MYPHTQSALEKAKKESDAVAGRHLKFIDQLVSDKRALSAKIDTVQKVGRLISRTAHSCHGYR